MSALDFIMPWKTRTERVSSWRCCLIWEVQFDMRDTGQMMSVPFASFGIGRGLIPLSSGFATKREITLLLVVRFKGILKRFPKTHVIGKKTSPSKYRRLRI